MIPPLDRIRRRLVPPTTDDPLDGEMEKRAAVAMILRRGEEGAEVLLMTRAEREGDRWSGQISMPGGREEEEDATLLETAIRETREEVGLDLARDGELLGRLPGIQARARGRLLSLAIAPFVFLHPAEASPRLGEEAAEAFWFPLERATAGEFDARALRPHEGREREFPCWNFEGREIWGLTYRMLSEFLRLTR